MKFGVSVNVGEKVSVRFDQTDYPTERAFLSWSTGSGRDYHTKLIDLLGWEEMDLECVDPLGNVTETSFSYDVFVDEESDYSECTLKFRNMQDISANVDYTLQKKSYKGEISTWTDNLGVMRRELYIDAMNARKSDVGFTAQDIRDILANYETGSFDGIRIVQPDFESLGKGANVISKEMIDTANDYLKQMEDRSITYEIKDYPGNTSIRWELYYPVSMSGDQQVTTSVGINENGKPYIKLGDTSKINASRINIEYTAQRGYADMADHLVDALGTKEMNIATEDGSARGYYSVNDWNVWFSLWNVSNLNPDTNYTIGKEVYNGNIFENGDGLQFFEIRYWEVENSGETFDEQAILRILNKQSKRDFSRVSIQLPANYTTISADVWSAMLNLMSDTADADQWHAVYLTVEGDYNTYWNFNWPEYTNRPVGLNANTAWSTDGSGMQFSLTETEYPAANPNISFGAELGSGAMSTFERAFGNSPMALEIVDEDGNVQNTDGYYDVYSWNGGSSKDVYIYSIQQLEAGKTYTLRRATYRGSEDYNPDYEYRRLMIEYSGFGNTGVAWDMQSFIDILKMRAATGVKYNNVHLVFPGQQYIPAELWNEAVALLKSPEEVEYFEDLAPTISFVSDTGYETYWSFTQPYAVEEGHMILLAQDMVFKPDSIDVTFNQTQFAAERSTVTFRTHSNKDDFQDFVNVFGYEESNPELVDQDGNQITRFYAGTNEWNDGMPVTGFTIDLWDVYLLDAGETYTMRPYVYCGDINEWKDGDGSIHLNLVINTQDEDGYTEEELLEILQVHEGKRFHGITINQRSDGNNVIWGSVIDAVVNLFEEDDFNFLRYKFSYGSDETYRAYDWLFHNIYGINGDFDAKVNIGAKGNIMLECDLQDIDAQSISFDFFAYPDSELATAITEYWGEGLFDLMLEGTDSTAQLDSEYGNFRLEYSDIRDLNQGQWYELVEGSYNGDSWGDDFYNTLQIDWNRFEQYEEEFSEEAVLAILERHAQAGNKYANVYISYPSKADKTVSKEVWNAACAVLNRDREEVDITIGFDDMETAIERWSFFNPMEVSEDVTMKVTVTFTTNGNGVSLKFVEDSYPSEDVHFGMFTETMRSDADKFEKAFGKESMELDLALNGEVSGVRGNYTCDVIEDAGYASYDLSIWGINRLTPGKTYKTQKYLYAGNINSWGSEEDPRYGLNIYAHDLGYDQIPKEELIAILQRNKGMKFEEINIECSVSENDIIYAEVVNESSVTEIGQYFEANRNVSVDGTAAAGWVEFNSEYAVIYLDDIANNIREDGKYTISSKQYTGEVYYWDDGTKALIIDEYGFRECLSEFTEETLVELLSSKAGEDFGQISIQ